MNFVKFKLIWNIRIESTRCVFFTFVLKKRGDFFFVSHYKRKAHRFCLFNVFMLQRNGKKYQGITFLLCFKERTWTSNTRIDTWICNSHWQTAASTICPFFASMTTSVSRRNEKHKTIMKNSDECSLRCFSHLISVFVGEVFSIASHTVH